MVIDENDGNDPNRLLIEALTTQFRTMLREETETLHEIIDQLEISNGDEEEIRRRRHDERPRKDRLMGIEIKVSHFQGRNDPVAYI